METQNFNIVLFEPEIPQNTGNIIRTCACTGSKLFLVGRLGFSMDDKHMKRCGLDYHDAVNIVKYNDLESLQKDYPDSDFYYLTTKSKNVYTERKFKKGDFFVFGPETRGLPEDLLFANADMALTVPMKEGQRSLNLSNTVAIVVYEAVRQCGLS
ncbi:MAG: tRNA (cytidine(34)-2'-O)-methyltransferase [Candidatus Gastranaerophilales bacterium]|nr:tRNA (cytidine(34)-2'-O)-methyltransferase [Candidatus Gastranaerophilales bacterium]